MTKSTKTRLSEIESDILILRSDIRRLKQDELKILVKSKKKNTSFASQEEIYRRYYGENEINSYLPKVDLKTAINLILDHLNLEIKEVTPDPMKFRLSKKESDK